MVLIVQLLTKLQTKEQYKALMKAIVEFNLEDADDARNHLSCIKAPYMAAMLWEIKNNLYKKCMNEAELSHGSVADVEEGVDIVFDKINDLFSRYNIDPEELTS